MDDMSTAGRLAEKFFQDCMVAGWVYRAGMEEVSCGCEEASAFTHPFNLTFAAFTRASRVGITYYA